jgi:hypothetical protein
MKVNLANDSQIDKEEARKRIKTYTAKYPDAKCKIYLLHGSLTEGQLKSLYTNPKIAALVNTSHGEGFGLPIFEAAGNDLPIIAPNWSGHLDFLTVDGKEMFSEVKCEIAAVNPQHVWKGVIEEGTGWAYIDTNHLKKRMLDMVGGEYPRLKARAVKHGKWIRETFNNKKVYTIFLKNFPFSEKIEEIKRDIKGISFCIPTNGKRVEKTKLTVKSIKNQITDIPYEIILCGDVSSFKDLHDVTLIDKSFEAHNRNVSSLRNNAAMSAKYDNIVFCDDDIIVPNEWISKLQVYSSTSSWDVLSNRILSPDGTRYWDRAILDPHIMVSYNHNKNDANLYQTSCFFVIRREEFEKVITSNIKHSLQNILQNIQ